MLNDSTVAITTSQLKTVNLAFLELSTLKVINAELDSQIVRYKTLYKNELIIDSLYDEKISILNKELNTQKSVIKEQENKLNKLKKLSLFTSSSALLLFGVCIVLL